MVKRLRSNSHTSKSFQLRGSNVATGCERSHYLSRGQQALRLCPRLLADGTRYSPFEKIPCGSSRQFGRRNSMKYKIVLASLLLMFAFANLAVARNSFRNNGGTEPGK